jgi:hypothetical protein
LCLGLGRLVDHGACRSWQPPSQAPHETPLPTPSLHTNKTPGALQLTGLWQYATYFGTYLYSSSLPRSLAPSLPLFPPLFLPFSLPAFHTCTSHVWRQRNAKRREGMRLVLCTWPDKILCQLGSRSSSCRGWRFICASTACLRLPWCRLLPSCAVRLCKSSSCFCENS